MDAPKPCGRGDAEYDCTDKLPEQQTPSVRTEITEPDYRAQKQELPTDTNRRSLLAQQLNTADETEREAVVQSLNAEPEVQTANVQERTAESAQANQEAAEVIAEEERTEKVERRRPSGSGSNPLTMPRYSSTQAITIMMI